MLPNVPGDVRLAAASIEAAGTDACLSRGGECPIVRQRCCPGGLGHGARSTGHTFVPPSFTVLRVPMFIGELCQGIHPSNRSCNRSPGPYPTARRADLSVVELPACRLGLVARGGGGFTHRALGASALCLCWQRNGSDSGHWPGRLVAGSIERPESDKSDSLALRVPAMVREALLETEISPAELGWPERLALAVVSASLLFSGEIPRFSWFKTVRNSSASWALGKARSCSVNIHSPVICPPPKTDRSLHID
jgi:hypothetical protein